MAEQENNNNTVEVEDEEILHPSFPLGRVRKIIKLDKDINKVNSEALFLITLSADLFLEHLALKSGEITKQKKKKTIQLQHMRLAVQRHQPTNDFLIDSLPVPTELVSRAANRSAAATTPVEKPLPIGTRRIDAIFQKSSVMESA